MDDFGFDGPQRSLVWRILLFPVKILRAIFGRFASADDLEARRGFLGWLKLIFVSPFIWIFSSLGVLLLNWSSSRRLQTFVFGLPAILFGLGMISLYVFGSLNPDGIVKVYNKNYQLALTEKKFDEAELYLNRVIRLKKEDQEDQQSQKADLLIQQGKINEAIPILQKIAKPDQVGNPRAHLQLAQYYLSKAYADAARMEELTLPKRAEFINFSQNMSIQHLEQCLNSTPSDLEEFQAHNAIYTILMRRKQFAEAAPHVSFLNRKTFTFSDDHFTFFTKIYPNLELANRQVEYDIARLKKFLEEQPDNMNAWQVLIRIYLMQKNYATAIKEISLGSRKVSTQQLKMLLAKFQSEVLYEQSINAKTLGTEKETRLQRLTLLSASLKVFPANRRAVEELILLGFPVEGTDDDQWLYDAKAAAGPSNENYYGVNMILGLRALFDGRKEEAKQYLELASSLSPSFPIVLQTLTMAIDPEAKTLLPQFQTEEKSPNGTNNSSAATPNADQMDTPALFGIYMVLGSHAVVEKKYQRGLGFFEKAASANPQSYAAQNNIAFCLINLESAGESEYQEALIISSDNIKKSPEIPNYYETRGAVFMKLERYQEAVADFEKALDRGFRNRRSVHMNLVKAYRETGRDKEADAYQRLIDAQPEEEGVPSALVPKDPNSATPAEGDNELAPETKSDSNSVGDEKETTDGTVPPVSSEEKSTIDKSTTGPEGANQDNSPN